MTPQPAGADVGRADGSGTTSSGWRADGLFAKADGVLGRVIGRRIGLLAQWFADRRVGRGGAVS